MKIDEDSIEFITLRQFSQPWLSTPEAEQSCPALYSHVSRLPYTGHLPLKTLIGGVSKVAKKRKMRKKKKKERKIRLDTI